MGERLLCKQKVIGSIPFTSTTGGHLHQVLVEAIAVEGSRFEARRGPPCALFCDIVERKHKS